MDGSEDCPLQIKWVKKIKSVGVAGRVVVTLWYQLRRGGSLLESCCIKENPNTVSIDWVLPAFYFILFFIFLNFFFYFGSEEEGRNTFKMCRKRWRTVWKVEVSSCGEKKKWEDRRQERQWKLCLWHSEWDWTDRTFFFLVCRHFGGRQLWQQQETDHEVSQTVCGGGSVCQLHVQMFGGSVHEDRSPLWWAA